MASEQLKNYLRNNCYGRRNAVKSLKLERALHISGNELRRQVNRLRRNRVPICSGPEGYFYARNAGEVHATICGLKDMVFGLTQAIDGLEESLDRFGEEMEDGAAGTGGSGG